MASVSEALARAQQQHQAGAWQQAEQLYRQVLELEPQHPQALHLLGVLAHQTGRHAEAVELIEQSLQRQSPTALIYNHLGAAYGAAGQLERAEQSFRKALELEPADAQIHFNLAALLNLRGQTQQAIDAYQEALRLNPQMAEAHYNLGNLLRDLGDFQRAANCFRQAIAANPRYVKAWLNLASVLRSLEDLEPAADAYRQVLRIQPQHAEAHYRLGCLLQVQAQWARAAEHLQQAVTIKPDHAEAQNNLGCALLALERPEQAAEAFQKAIQLNQTFAEAHNNLGTAQQALHRSDEALASYEQAIAIRPDFADAYNNLGCTLRDRKRLAEALAALDTALELRPNYVDALSNRGIVLQDLGRVEEAVAEQRRALAIKPDYIEGHYNLGSALHRAGKYDEALAAYGEAIRLKPEHAESRFNGALLRLARGDFSAWTDYQWRLRCKHYPKRPINRPTWDGSPLADETLLVHAEQGLGDTLHFIRYLPLVRQRAKQVVLEVPPALLPLLNQSGFTDVVAAGAPLPNFDVHIPLLSLPGVLGTTLATIPADVPYLQADPKLVDLWRGVLEFSGFRIGINWQGNSSYMFDRFRSIPLVEFAPLAEVPHVQLVSLQKKEGLDQLAAVADQFSVIDLGTRMDEVGGAFMDTAAAMKSLDLIVTSDTATAHLAGALGVRTWLALSFTPEWRWMLDRSDSPWYPTLRLFRQPTLGDWKSVFEEMARELRSLVAESNDPAASVPARGVHGERL